MIQTDDTHRTENTVYFVHITESYPYPFHMSTALLTNGHTDGNIYIFRTMYAPTTTSVSTNDNTPSLEGFRRAISDARCTKYVTAITDNVFRLRNVMQYVLRNSDVYCIFTVPNIIRCGQKQYLPALSNSVGVRCILGGSSLLIPRL
jgi:hypothetical protein